MASILYELFIGMSEGAERVLISDYVMPNERGTAFGWYHLASGLAAIPAGLLFGIFTVRPALFCLHALLQLVPHYYYVSGHGRKYKGKQNKHGETPWNG